MEVDNMTEVMCEYMMCKFNESCTPGKAGLCLKAEIKLQFREERVEEFEYLDCIDFVWDNNKKLVNE
jgi:hypothetical protein